jgi:hypothetical protein
MGCVRFVAKPLGFRAQPAPPVGSSMPALCTCGARLRKDRSCKTPRCPKFRASLQGSNLAPIRVRQRLKGPKCAALPKDHRCSTQRLQPQEAEPQVPQGTAEPAELQGPSPDSAKDAEPASQAIVRAALRRPDLEDLLVDLFGEPAYFTILATAYRRPN